MTPRVCSREHNDRPINGVCPACLLIAEGNADRLEHLRAEVRQYLDGYTSRGIRMEGEALVKLRKAIETHTDGESQKGDILESSTDR